METLRLLSSTETNSGSITHAIKGCFRQPGQPDVLLARYNSLQLCSLELNRFEEIQPLFVPILQLQTFPWRGTAFLHTLPRVDWGKDLVVMLSSTGKVAVLKYCTYLRRFVSATGVNIPFTQSVGQQEEPWYFWLDQLSLYPSSPCIATASPKRALLFPLDLRQHGDPKAFGAWLGADSIAQIEPHTTCHLILSMCQLPGSQPGNGRGESHPLLAILLQPHSEVDTQHILIYAGCFTEDGKVIGQGYVLLRSFMCEGSVLHLVSIPPSCGGLGVVGLIIVQMEGLNVVEMGQLLELVADGKQALQPTASWTHLRGPTICWAFVEHCESLGVALAKEDAGGAGCVVITPLTSRHTGTRQLPLPDAATCLLSLNARDLLASFANIQPHVLSCLGASWEVLQPPNLAETKRERSEWQWMSTQNGFVHRPIDWGAGGLADFIAHEREGRHEVIGVANNELFFLGRGREAPLEAEGPEEARAVTGIWCVQNSSSGLWHSVALISYADASRAVAAGMTLVDVSESCGICQDEPTLAAGSIADSVLVQVTPSRVCCCSLGGLVDGDLQELCGSASKKHGSLAANFANLGVDDTSGGHSPLDARPPDGHDRHAMEACEASPCPAEDKGCSNMGRDDCTWVRLLPITRQGAYLQDCGGGCSLQPSQGDDLDFGQAWRPPPGTKISAAVINAGLVVVFYGVASAGHLAALRCRSAPVSVKRKRDGHDIAGLELACTTPLHSNPSCMDLKRCQKGGFDLVVCLYGPSLKLFRVVHALSGAEVGFFHVGDISEASLSSSIEGVATSSTKILGTEPAESIHLLPDQGVPHTAEAGGAAMRFSLLASWRTGYLLHLRLDARPRIGADQMRDELDNGPEESSTSGECVLEPELLALLSLGNSPPVVRQFPGEEACFLAVGKAAAVVSYDAEFARLAFERQELPSIRCAVPMFVRGKGDKCHKLLVCAQENSNKLQLRKVLDRPRNASGASVAVRHHQCGPQTVEAHCEQLVLLPATNALAVSDAARRGFDVISDFGKGLRLSISTEQERVTCLAAWRPKQASSGEEQKDHTGRGKPDLSEQLGEQTNIASGCTGPQAPQTCGDDEADDAGGSHPLWNALCMDDRANNIDFDTDFAMEEYLVVGTESVKARQRLDALVGLPTGTVMVFHVGREPGGYPTTKLVAQQIMGIPVRSCCTIMWGGSLCLMVSTSRHMTMFTLRRQRGYTVGGARHGEIRLEIVLQQRLDHDVREVSSSPSCRTCFTTADAAQGGALWAPVLDAEVDSDDDEMPESFVLLASSRHRHPATSSLPFCYKPRCLEGTRKLGAEGSYYEQPTAGDILLVTVDAKGCLHACLEPYDTASGSVAAGNLGAPLLKIREGFSNSEKTGRGGDLLVSAASGQLFRVKLMDERFSNGVAAALHSVLAHHWATSPVTGDSHQDLRAAALTGGATPILDGDLLAQFLLLPPSTQAEISQEVFSYAMQDEPDLSSGVATLCFMLRHDCGLF